MMEAAAPGTIENDVLFGLEGELFLASGGHRVLEYASGKIPIDPAVIDVFYRNIKARSDQAARANIPYLHVIFPDKQSVLPDKFPVVNPICLGDLYLGNLEKANLPILYPLGLLRSSTKRPFLGTDTHLTDHGTILVACRIVEILLGTNVSVYREKLGETLTLRRNHIGDLGGKLEPVRETEETFSQPTWQRSFFHNEIPGGNNGGVDIYFSPDAIFRKRLLLFGDSFGREAAKFLSYFFSEILFLRTPFFHPEIIEQMRPDLIVSDNVERYLISCTSDEKRPLFFMFPFLSGRAYKPNEQFADAFSAIMSYPRSPYIEFTNKIFGHSTRLLQSGGKEVTIDKADDGVPPEESIEIPEPNASRAKTMGIIPYIHKHDFIFKFVARKWGADVERAINNYYDLGQYSAKITVDIVEEVIRVKKSINQEWNPKNLLDFASGYGCCSRYLPKAFPGCSVSTCDIHEEAIDFNSRILRLESYLSAASPENLTVPFQDVIVAMSFFSHMPNATYTRWLQSLAQKLNPGGVLIFTTNGFVTETIGTTNVIAGRNGFGFEPRSEQIDLDGGQYGITISHPRWVLRALEQVPELRLARFQEGNWWAIQDTYVCVRETN